MTTVSQTKQHRKYGPNIIMKSHLRLKLTKEPHVEETINTALNPDKEVLFHRVLNVDITKLIGNSIIILKKKCDVKYESAQVEQLDSCGKPDVYDCSEFGSDILVMSNFKKGSNASDVEKDVNYGGKKVLIIKNTQYARSLISVNHADSITARKPSPGSFKHLKDEWRRSLKNTFSS